VSTRFVRFLTLYLKMIAMMCASSYLLGTSTPVFIILTIVSGEILLFFIKIMKAELSGGVFAKLIGISMFGGIIFAAWYIYLFE
jgi:hypothetical protein